MIEENSCTTSERGTPPPSDHDENDDDEEEAEKLALETNSPTPVSGQKRKHLDKKGIVCHGDTGFETLIQTWHLEVGKPGGVEF